MFVPSRDQGIALAPRATGGEDEPALPPIPWDRAADNFNSNLGTQPPTAVQLDGPQLKQHWTTLVVSGLDSETQESFLVGLACMHVCLDLLSSV